MIPMEIAVPLTPTASAETCKRPTLQNLTRRSSTNTNGTTDSHWFLSCASLDCDDAVALDAGAKPGPPQLMMPTFEEQDASTPPNRRNRSDSLVYTAYTRGSTDIASILCINNAASQDEVHLLGGLTTLMQDL